MILFIKTRPKIWLYREKTSKNGLSKRGNHFCNILKINTKEKLKDFQSFSFCK